MTLEELKAAYPAQKVALQIGMKRRQRDRWGPCPACGEDSDSAGRGAVRIGSGWWCNSCGVHGSALALVAWKVHGQGLKGCSGPKWRALVEYLEGAPSVPADDYTPKEKQRRNPNEVAAILQASTPAHRSRRPDVCAWLRERALEGLRIPAWVLPERSPRGVPRSWGSEYPLVVPCYSGLGVLTTLHGRRVAGEGEKSKWLRGGGGGWLFADPWRALPMLRNEPVDLEGVVFVEGLPDYLTMAGSVKRLGAPWAVLGIESGSEKTIAVSRLADVPLIIATHDDTAGDAYTDRIGDVLSETHNRFASRMTPAELCALAR